MLQLDDIGALDLNKQFSDKVRPLSKQLEARLCDGDVEAAGNNEAKTLVLLCQATYAAE